MQYGSQSNGGQSKQNILPNAIITEDNANWSVLHNTVAAGDDKCLQTLLGGANVDRTVKESKCGNTPLHEAASRGYSRCVRLLCTVTPTPVSAGGGGCIGSTKPNAKKSGADKKLKGIVNETRNTLNATVLSIKNDQGFTALHLAAQNGHNQSCRELLLAGADPDIQNYYGDTPLHTACRYGHAGAARILLSAECDPNKQNLNNDTPLHITCAMGKKKLTRILLEAECDMEIKNAQGERPRDIALRKNFSEILEILQNPHQMRNRRSSAKDNNEANKRHRSSNRSHRLKDLNNISWSPYGCHYFPDPCSFPPPKLETLPKEPLRKGEQYYLDLAGNIRKGPIGVGNTCYCGHLFRHIEDKINCNHKHLKKYVHRAKESLGNKVHELAIRTNVQIEQLTRSMVADRIRCENKRIYLNQYLRRGELQRMTAEEILRSKWKQQQQQQQQQGSDGEPCGRRMARCHSLEILDHNVQVHTENFLTNSKSCEQLEERATTENTTNDLLERNSTNNHKQESCGDAGEHPCSAVLSASLQQAVSQDLVDDDDMVDSSVSPVHLMEDNVDLPTSYDLSLASSAGASHLDCGLTRFADSSSLADDTVIERPPRARSQDALQIVQPLREASPAGNNLQQFRSEAINYEDPVKIEAACGSATNISGNEFVEMPSHCPQSLKPSYALLNKIKREATEFANQNQRNSFYYGNNNNIVEPFEHGLNPESTAKKVEIKSSEIKTLKKRIDNEIVKKNRVQELVARLQGKLTIGAFHKSTKHAGNGQADAQEVATYNGASDSESSEDDKMLSPHKQEYLNNVLTKGNGTVWDCKNPCNSSPIQSEIIKENLTYYKVMSTTLTDQTLQSEAQKTIVPKYADRFVPKDAYFHELPHKSVNNHFGHPEEEPTAISPALFQARRRDTVSPIDDCGISNTYDLYEEHPQRLPSRNAHNHNWLSMAHCSSPEEGLTPQELYTNSNYAGIPMAIPKISHVERDISNDSGFSTRMNSDYCRPSQAQQMVYTGLPISEIGMGSLNASRLDGAAYVCNQKSTALSNNNYVATDIEFNFNGNVSSLV